MKAGLSIVAGLLATAVTALDERPHAHRHRHMKRQDVVVDYVTDIEVVTTTAPNAVVYVDGNGNPTSTSYYISNPPAPVSTSAPSWFSSFLETATAGETPTTFSYAPGPSSTTPAATSDASAPAPTPTSTTDTPTTLVTSVSAAPPAYSTSATPPARPSSAAAPSSSAASSGSLISGHGISYSPYNSDSSCKTQAQINEDISRVDGYSLVRIYGTDCNQTAMVNAAALSKGMQVMASVYDITSVQSEIQSIIDAGNLDNIHTVAVGNEGVNDGTYTVDAVVSAIGQARSQLQAAGYTGNVVTVDTFVAMIANPQLCEASDFAAANCHAFFDGGVTAQDAGNFVVSQAQRVSQACGGKDTVITESGWPSAGEINGVAVPSAQDQQDAIASLKSAFSSNLVVFDMYNDYWKENSEGTFGAEQFWGIYGDSST